MYIYISVYGLGIADCKYVQQTFCFEYHLVLERFRVCLLQDLFSQNNFVYYYLVANETEIYKCRKILHRK